MDRAACGLPWDRTSAPRDEPRRAGDREPNGDKAPPAPRACRPARPQVQVPLHDDKGQFIGRPDLYYPAQRLALEYDGAIHRDTMTADHRRQNRLINAGYRLLRFTAADVVSNPDSVVLLVRQALVARDLP